MNPPNKSTSGGAGDTAGATTSSSGSTSVFQVLFQNQAAHLSKKKKNEQKDGLLYLRFASARLVSTSETSGGKIGGGYSTISEDKSRTPGQPCKTYDIIEKQLSRTPGSPTAGGSCSSALDSFQFKLGGSSYMITIETVQELTTELEEVETATFERFQVQQKKKQQQASNNKASGKRGAPTKGPQQQQQQQQQKKQTLSLHGRGVVDLLAPSSSSSLDLPHNFSAETVVGGVVPKPLQQQVDYGAVGRMILEKRGKKRQEQQEEEEKGLPDDMMVTSSNFVVGCRTSPHSILKMRGSNSFGPSTAKNTNMLLGSGSQSPKQRFSLYSGSSDHPPPQDTSSIGHHPPAAEPLTLCKHDTERPNFCSEAGFDQRNREETGQEEDSATNINLETERFCFSTNTTSDAMPPPEVVATRPCSQVVASLSEEVEEVSPGAKEYSCVSLPLPHDDTVSRRQHLLKVLLKGGFPKPGSIVPKYSSLGGRCGGSLSVSAQRAKEKPLDASTDVPCHDDPATANQHHLHHREGSTNFKVGENKQEESATEEEEEGNTPVSPPLFLQSTAPFHSTAEEED